MEKIYTGIVTAKGGRDGQVKSDDGIIDFQLHRPTEMGGEGGNFTNPEQLFAGAYGACYLGALGAVAKHNDTDVTEATAKVLVSLNKDGNAYALSAEIHVHIPGMELDEVQQLADKAHRACPYSKAVKGNMDVKVIAV